jgi:hypothetical protein
MGEGTFAGTRGNDENAPIPVVRANTIDRLKPTNAVSRLGRRDRRRMPRDGPFDALATTVGAPTADLAIPPEQ